MSKTSSWLARFTQYLVWRSRQDYSRYEIIGAVLFGSFLELGAIPVAFIIIGRQVDGLMGWAPILSQGQSCLLAAACFMTGVPWLGWSIALQHSRGRGTPLPLVPTKQFLSEGPYRFVRNPMTLGAILWMSGWAFVSNSLAAMTLGVAGFSSIVLSYIKLVEEKELLARFGAPYRKYKDRTPFLIPIRSSSKSKSD